MQLIRPPLDRYIVAALLISALLLTPEHQGEPSFVAIETTRALDTLSAESQSRDQRSLLPSASSLTETGDVVSANSKAAGLATSMLEPIAPSSVLAESPRPRLVQKNVLRHAAMVELPSSPFDGKPVGPSANEDLWKLALGAATVRGEDKKPRLSAFKSKRVGPRRHDGLSFKAGEDGCPPKPKGAGKFVKGDHRLAKIHFVHPPKSGGTTFGLVTVIGRLYCLFAAATRSERAAVKYFCILKKNLLESLHLFIIIFLIIVNRAWLWVLAGGSRVRAQQQIPRNSRLLH